MNTVYNFRQILLFIEIRKFEDKSLGIVSGQNETNTYVESYLGKANFSNEIEEIVDVIGMAKIQLGRLEQNIYPQQGEKTPPINTSYILRTTASPWKTCANFAKTTPFLRDSSISTIPNPNSLSRQSSIHS